MRLRILHHTHYGYTSPVVMAQHLAHLRPLERPGQTLLRHEVRIGPTPAHQERSPDAFGNERLFFTLQSPHDELDVWADSEVLTSAPEPSPDSDGDAPAATDTPWDSVRQHFAYHAHAPYDPASEFLFASPYVPRHPTLAEFARPAFEPGVPWLAACEALMERIHQTMAYDSASTGVNTPVLDALDQQSGVCQDFAHLMVGCLRSLGLPARYVSGYLLTQPPPGQARLVGADASHAWVSAYCPPTDPQAEGQWWDFCPTNARLGLQSPGEDYVTLAMGRDFGDVSPLRGVIQGGGQHRLRVGVTVAPPDEWPGDPHDR
jgi:transglutaminase-like putative cysteine protease